MVHMVHGILFLFKSFLFQLEEELEEESEVS